MQSKLDAYSALTKISNKLPQIEFKTPNEIELTTLLKPVESIISVSDTESSEAESDIPDMFEDVHRNSFLKPSIDENNKKKFLNKTEADKRTFEMFTEDFKQILRETRNTLKIDPSLIAENEEDIIQVLNDTKNEPLLKPSKKIVVGEEPISVSTDEDQESSGTSNSGLWNMIKAQRGRYFRASPPCYNIFEEGTDIDNYLLRPHIPWTVIDKSLKKCEKWLSDLNK